MTTSINDGLVTGTHTSLHAPRVSLSSCIRAYITRSTMDAPPMPERQRYNHYPKVPFCTITWNVHGQVELRQMGDDEVDVVLGSINFNGPRTVPSVTYNPGKVELFMLVLSPEALHVMTGIDMTAYVNRSARFEEVFDSTWQAMARQVQQALDHAQRIRLIEDFIEPRWMEARSGNSLIGNWLRDHIEGMPVRLLASELGKSLRQLERRVKTQTGLPLQRLLGMLRDERRFVAAREPVESGASWSDIAADSGYADQARFCRETRRATGLTPNEVKRCIANEESYWIYRIWS